MKISVVFGNVLLCVVLCVEEVMGAAYYVPERKLNQTPTWAVAFVCFVIILISILLEKGLLRAGAWLTERRKRALYEALEKIKDELMILGFISLCLTFGQDYFVKICVPTNVVETMWPCSKEESYRDNAKGQRRKLLFYDHRFLAATSSKPVKCSPGKEPLLSKEGLHQLHILIFFLAVSHVLSCFATMMLGRLKIRGWEEWEKETLSNEYELTNDPSRFRYTRETSFVRAHNSSWTRIPVLFYIGCFFRQFFRSVGKADYLTLRNGFITLHLAPGSKFNFQKYVMRSLEDDFKVVMGVGPILWATFVLFLLLNVDGWHTMLWASILPLVIILLVGTKLQAILTRMATEITERNAFVKGMPLVQGSDKYFWFGRPKFLLYLIQFALFQNAFQIIYFFWIWYSFSLKSCFHTDLALALVKLGLGFITLVVCSYVTLPVYALVTQMGSLMKRTIFDEQMSKALKKWHMGVRKKQREGRLGGSAIHSPLSLHSAGPTLHRFKTTGHSTHSHHHEEDGVSDSESEELSPSSGMTPDLQLVLHNPEDQQPPEIITDKY